MRRRIKILLYQFSRSKRQLDQYCKLFRQGHKFSDSEVEKLKQLIVNEQHILNGDGYFAIQYTGTPIVEDE